MEIILNIPDEIGRKIQNLTDVDGFVTDAIRKALEHKIIQQQKVTTLSSKWAKISKRINDDPIHLEGYSYRLKNDMKEFRENFKFQHDE
jgi:hypothetical protein